MREQEIFKTSQVRRICWNLPLDQLVYCFIYRMPVAKQSSGFMTSKRQRPACSKHLCRQSWGTRPLHEGFVKLRSAPGQGLTHVSSILFHSWGPTSLSAPKNIFLSHHMLSHPHPCFHMHSDFISEFDFPWIYYFYFWSTQIYSWINEISWSRGIAQLA